MGPTIKPIECEAEQNKTFTFGWNYCKHRTYCEDHALWTINTCVINLIFGLCSYLTVIFLTYLLYRLIIKKMKNKVKNETLFNDIRLYILILLWILSFLLGL